MREEVNELEIGNVLSTVQEEIKEIEVGNIPIILVWKDKDFKIGNILSIQENIKILNYSKVWKMKYPNHMWMRG